MMDARTQRCRGARRGERLWDCEPVLAAASTATMHADLDVRRWALDVKRWAFRCAARHPINAIDRDTENHVIVIRNGSAISDL
jgi:hypothetical protein